MDSHEDMAGAEWETVVEQESHDYPEWAEDSEDETEKPNIISRLENVDDSDSDDGFNVAPSFKVGVDYDAKFKKQELAKRQG